MKITSEKWEEKKRLELIEKKIDIQKKRLEIRKEKIEVKKQEIKKTDADEQMLLILKVDMLNKILSNFSIDEAKTLFGSEPVFKNTFSENESVAVKAKLMEIIKRF
ncbi:MAG: hypothetical protein ABI199_04380 [Bacteroidia bacterium]